MWPRLFRQGSRPRPAAPFRFRPGLERLDDRWLPSTVTNANDAGPGSLRQAILDSNASRGVVDTIAFAIPGAGPHTITPGATNGVATGLGALPHITDPVVIDGYSQPGAATATATTAAVPQIVLDGSHTPSFDPGLVITAGGSTVRGLVVNQFVGGCIELRANGGNVIE